MEPAVAAFVVQPTPQPRLLPDTFSTVEPEARDSRAVREALVPTATPLATPVAVDPDTTPLAAPTSPPKYVGPVWPVSSTIGQYFSAGHPALDLLAPCGTPVVASMPGTIVQAGWKNNGGGNVVIVDSGNGFVIEYNHLQGVALIGGWVNAGTVIGWIGATGWATGCHLHFTIILNGIFQNPLAFF